MQKIYGVKMTSLQEMQFSKFRNENGIAMNMLTEAERLELTQNWLNNHFPDNSNMVTSPTKPPNSKI